MFKWALVLLVGFFIFFTGIGFSQEESSLESAFKNGKISGEIGNYFEYLRVNSANSNYGWSSAYLTLKYETAKWNNLKLGARFFAHGELYSDHDNGSTDPFAADIEKKYTLPELYLNYGFSENSDIVIGRFDHQKISHIDDAQSEGGYISYKEIEGLELVGGFMRRFAEIDYDDGEDFGRNNETQDLKRTATYGNGSTDYLFFVEAKCAHINWLDFNPYIYYQDGYASVYGFNTKAKAELEDINLTYGVNVDIYHVNADIAGSNDATVFGIKPFVKKDNLSFELRYAKYDDDSALNKPAWFYDEFDLVDQNFAEGNNNANIYEGIIKVSLDKWWTSLACSMSDYTYNSSEGDEATDIELQFGYKLTKNLDINLRLFDVQYEDVNNRDYRKLESRVRFKF